MVKEEIGEGKGDEEGEKGERKMGREWEGMRYEEEMKEGNER